MPETITQTDEIPPPPYIMVEPIPERVPSYRAEQRRITEDILCDNKIFVPVMFFIFFIGIITTSMILSLKY
jgi:hypothetical protein